MRLLTLLLLGACATRLPPPVKFPEVQKVEIVAEPPACYVDDVGEVPEKPAWPSGDEDFYRRIYVHRADYDKLHEFVSDLYLRQSEFLDCLKKLANVY